MNILLAATRMNSFTDLNETRRFSVYAPKIQKYDFSKFFQNIKNISKNQDHNFLNHDKIKKIQKIRTSKHPGDLAYIYVLHGVNSVITIYHTLSFVFHLLFTGSLMNLFCYQLIHLTLTITKTIFFTFALRKFEKNVFAFQRPIL